MPAYHRLRVERLGCAPADTDPLALGRGETVEIAVRLGVTAVPLAPFTIVDRRTDAPRSEFQRRLDVGRRSGFLRREQRAERKLEVVYAARLSFRPVAPRS